MVVQVTTGFNFTFNWLRWSCEFSAPITDQSKAKPTWSETIFDNQLKIALKTILSGITYHMIQYAVLLVIKKNLKNLRSDEVEDNCLDLTFYLPQVISMWLLPTISIGRSYLDLTPNSRNQFTRKCVAASGEN